jgi:hypothetical protein
VIGGRGTPAESPPAWRKPFAASAIFSTVTPALQALADEVAGDDLAAYLTGMGSGESAELRCENGTFEIVRDR